MTNKNKKTESQQGNQQPIAPAQPVELSDEELEQITGGFNPQPDPPGDTTPDGTVVDA